MTAPEVIARALCSNWRADDVQQKFYAAEYLAANIRTMPLGGQNER